MIQCTLHDRDVIYQAYMRNAGNRDTSRPAFMAALEWSGADQALIHRLSELSDPELREAIEAAVEARRPHAVHADADGR